MTKMFSPALRLTLLAGAVFLMAVVFLPGASAMPSQPRDDGPVLASQATEGPTYALDFRWSAWGWLGETGVDIMTAFAGNTSPDGDLSTRITAVYTWDQVAQRWRGYFPAGVGIPGVNDFDSFTRFEAYFIAITPGPSATFIPPAQ